MANLFVDHKQRWLALAESESDFPILFIRSWIPFNAWYCNAYPDKNNNDRPILDAMKEDNNLFRTRIIALLNGSDTEALGFKNALTQLYYGLERFYIPDVANRITFNNIYFRQNPIVSDSKRFRNCTYKAEIIRTVISPGNIQIQVKAEIVDTISGAFRYRYPPQKYKRESFINDISNPVNTLTDEMRAYITACFDNVDPKRKESIILPSKRNAMVIGNIPFVKDTDLMSKAIIELLYNLRCILFHGEVQPSRDNLSIYEHAYYMLRILIKSLN